MLEVREARGRAPPEYRNIRMNRRPFLMLLIRHRGTLTLEILVGPKIIACSFHRCNRGIRTLEMIRVAHHHHGLIALNRVRGLIMHHKRK